MTDETHIDEDTSGIVAALATTGHPNLVIETVRQLQTQSRIPDRIIICLANEEDVEPLRARLPNVEIFFGGQGITCQRNAIMSILKADDVVVFFDEDFLPAENYLEEVERIFEIYPDIIMATGHIIADGNKGTGIDVDEARMIILHDDQKKQYEDEREIIASYHAANSCNMAIRMHPVIHHQLHFDEKLPLFGWLEDIEFSYQIYRYGRIVKCSALRGVHLGVKNGYSSSLRFGYSQVANPVYLMRRNRCSKMRVLTLMLSNFAANTFKSIAPEPNIDRFGRLRGNLLALFDLLRGKLDPQRIKII